MVNFKNLIRMGKISSVNYTLGRVRICFEDQDGMVTDEIPYFAFEYDMPEINDLVVCVGLGVGVFKGFCLGGFFFSQNLPGQSGKDIYFKWFKKEAWLKYDRASKTLTIKAENLVFDGDVNITGALDVTGDAVIGGISFLNHGHPYSWGHDPGSGITGPPE